MEQVKIPAVYMRGGTSKGVFFKRESLPADAALRDRVLLRVMGSPDPYGQQIDGMGGATSSTSKVMVIGPSSRADCDVEYSFGQVAVDRSFIDWSGNCGNLTSAVAPFAIEQGWVKAPSDGLVGVRMLHTGLHSRIVAYVPVKDGRVIEDGDFELDGVTFPAAEIRVEFFMSADVEQAAGRGGIFPTGHPIDTLDVPGIGVFEVTMMGGSNPAVLIDAEKAGLRSDALQVDVNGDALLLAKCEAIRAHAVVRMGLARTAADATALRPHSPKLLFVAPPCTYAAAGGRMVERTAIDLSARTISMGKLHHAMTGTGAIALGAAAAIPGTVVHRLLGRTFACVRFGHPSGVMVAGAEAEERNGAWRVTKVVISRTARRLMEGSVFVPARCFQADASGG